MEYLITGYPHGNGRHIEFGKVEAFSKKEALDNIKKSVWYTYHATKFDQDEYDKLKNANNIERF